MSQSNWRALFMGCAAAATIFTGTLKAPAAETEVRPIPPPGIEISDETRQQLQQGLATLREKIAALQRRRDALTPRLLPDVQIFEIAVARALEEGTFYNEKDAPHAVELLTAGNARADQLLAGQHPWTSQNGLIVRGYRSRLDGSVQPYGLVIGAGVDLGARTPVRCDIWFRGRSEKGLELQFVHERMHSSGEFPLDNGIVLHPFGRYCNANRFAGEVDVLEALEHAQADYPLDSDRTSVRGFSMGGAACWGFTVHYPCRWFASNPGAGFSETLQFRGLDKNPAQLPPWYEQRMWRLYDADTLADNLFDVPVIAYSGEIDKQKLAADIMVAAAGKRGLEFPHIIGPETAHKFHPDSKKIIARQMEEWAQAGRNRTRAAVRFCTFSLKYNRCDWIILNGLEEHWEEAYVDGDVVGTSPGQRALTFKTRNCNDFTADFRETEWKFEPQEPTSVTIDGHMVALPKGATSTPPVWRFRKGDAGWMAVAVDAPRVAPLVKRHNLQGPVDDALMDSFLFVEPTGADASSAVDGWVNSERTRAVREWRRQMRGEVRSKKESEITPEDIRNHHLILWGTPQSNRLIGQIADKLPIRWTSSEIAVGDQKYDPQHHAVILVYPNPLNPEKYIVLNSGLTYREIDYLNNSWQTPKLPDWAVVDVRQAPTSQSPGKVVDANFFDEHWQLKPRQQK